jgi:general secretion pathway protein J
MTARRSAPDSGFTLIEALISTGLLLSILAALATVTAQWLPNWDRGLVKSQRNELLALGIERIVADLSAAESIPTNAEDGSMMFDGSERSITLVRTAIGPNAPRGLEIVKLGEVGDAGGPVVVRTTTPYLPLSAEEMGELRFANPVALIRPPFRLTFSYAGSDRQWLSTWQGSALPSAIRLTIRDSASGRTLPVSTAVVVHANAPAGCVRDGGRNCFGQSPAPVAAAPQDRQPQSAGQRR